MKLYTGAGDHGETSLFDGSRVPKNELRVAAYGQLDGLNSLLGWCCCAPGAGLLVERITRIQSELFCLGAELATPPEACQRAFVPLITASAGRRLEQWIDEAVAATPELHNFILPGGCELAARLHLARTACRDAERSVVALHRRAPLRDEVLVYLNRLSDLLFAWARLANHAAGVPESLWKAET